MPSIGRKKKGEYVRTWQMEPLVIAVLASLTPSDIERVFFDDRIEDIDYDDPTDLAAISVETFTAKRAYRIAEIYRKRGIPVVMGGFHPTLMPQEAKLYADAVVIGEAEGVWQKVLEDARNGKLREFYQGEGCVSDSPYPDRGVYGGRRYLDLALVETGRGCRFSCNFCSISAFFRRTYRPKKVGDVVAEISSLRAKTVFLIDDNVAADAGRAKELFRAFLPLGIRWISQISIRALQDDTLLSLMAESGCAGVLVGFESLNPANLAQMNKEWNGGCPEYSAVLARLRGKGIAAYPTFVFGYDHDTAASFKDTLDFALRERFFFIAFNHLVPFPGTPLYESLRAQGRLLYDAWWLHDGYSFGDVSYKPKNFTPGELSRMCFDFRKKFYSYPSIFRRGCDVRGNCNGFFKAGVFFSLNMLARKEVGQRYGLPLGRR
jgi:radical SAM superfamily enzyme YgiQ (UPF0313 family)